MELQTFCWRLRGLANYLESRDIEAMETVMGTRSLSVEGRLVDDDEEVLLTNVYGPNIVAVRELFQKEIQKSQKKKNN